MEGPFAKFAHKHSFASSFPALFIYYFFCALFYSAVPQLTECLEEANIKQQSVSVKELSADSCPTEI